MGVVHSLICHPNQLQSDRFKVEAKLDVVSHGMNCEFRILGDVQNLVVPEMVAQPERQWGLWNSTCVEFFVLFENGQYVEFNLSPSMNWEMFHQEFYRQGTNAFAEAKAQSQRQLKPDQLLLSSDVQCPLLGEPTSYGLTTVLECQDGSKSHWAIRHLNLDKPDFHDPNGFAPLK